MAAPTLGGPAQPAADDRVAAALRAVTLALLVAAPLALGSVHRPAWVPLLLACFAVGLGSWARGHWRRAHGIAVPRFPGTRLLLALHALVLFQLLPLPPSLLRLLSPGTFAFHDDPSLVPLTAWRPISVNPPDTLRGLLFLAGMSLFAAAVHREFAEPRRARRLAGTVVATALLVTLIGLVQAAGRDPARIYGLYRPAQGLWVFGPYVNKNYYAGYVVMAIPLAIAFAAGAISDLRRAWARRARGRGWLALGERAGSLALGASAVALALLVGLLLSRSRGGLLAFLVSAVALPRVLRHRRTALLVVVLVVAAAIGFAGASTLDHPLASRGRVGVWADSLRMAARFPLFGVGWNAFGSAYPRYQTVWKELWWGQAHNDYLQVLTDGGLAGVALVASLLWLLYSSAARGAARGPLQAGLLGALLALGAHCLVDFQWQIPANALTFSALAGLALRDAGLEREEVT